MKYFDTHCHLNGQFYQENIDEDIKKAIESGIDKILLPGTGKRDSLLAIEMSKTHPNLFAAAGIHPSDAAKESVDYLNEINPDDIVAVGEVGIDLYHEENPSLKIQEEVFRAHLDFAKKHNKPVIIHMRESENEVFRILQDYKGIKFVMHSFTSTPEWASKFIVLGGYISISGIVTFKNAHQVLEVAKSIPLERMLAETDAPFLTPVPHRGKANKPEYVKHVVDFIASIRDEEEHDVVSTLYNNSVKFFLEK